MEVQAAFGVDNAERCVCSVDDEAEDSAEVLWTSEIGALLKTGL